jgi:cytosine/adenosine deaminase-related metal-dependent hydrolase
LCFILPTVDVAGGYSYSMLDAIRRAVMVSNILLINKVNEKSLTIKEVFRLATLGGSQGNDYFISQVQPCQSVSLDSD